MATVGKFTINDGVIAGPAAYINSLNYDRRKELIEQGRCLVTNEAIKLGHSLDHAIGVAHQTDYAAWCGLRQLHAQYPSTIGDPQ